MSLFTFVSSFNHVSGGLAIFWYHCLLSMYNFVFVCRAFSQYVFIFFTIIPGLTFSILPKDLRRQCPSPSVYVTVAPRNIFTCSHSCGATILIPRVGFPCLSLSCSLCVCESECLRFCLVNVFWSILVVWSCSLCGSVPFFLYRFCVVSSMFVFASSYVRASRFSIFVVHL